MWLESDGFLSFWNVNLYQLPIVWISKLLIAVCYLLIHSQAYWKLIVILHMSNFKSNDIEVYFVKFTVLVFISAKVVWNWNQKYLK